MPVRHLSSNSTFTSGFSARRRGTTDPEEPDPHTMKSYCAFNPVIRRSWFAPHTLLEFHSGWIQLNICVHFAHLLYPSLSD